MDAASPRGQTSMDTEMPVLETKLHPTTPRQEWLSRPHLVHRLGEAARSPITLVAASAGYGKSTLLTQWFSGCAPGTVAWLDLDPADTDPVRLWLHLATALERVGCRIDDDLATFIASSATTITSRVVPRVIDALAALDHPVTIVLDNCHDLRSSDGNAQLDQLIHGLPDHVKVILASRADPDLRLGRLRVEGRLAEIRTTDLAFTSEEIQQLLQTREVSLSAPALAELELRTEGWPAAVYLAVLTLAGEPDPEGFVRRLSGSDRFIADYLGEEVLGRQDAELRGFILSISVFDRFNTSLADAVTRTQSAPRLLRRLERTNLFLSSLHGGTWYRFHHLFRTFARSALAVEAPESVADLHRRGASWFAQHDQIEEAVRHTLTAGDHGEAASLIQRHWLRFLDAGRLATVRGWMAQLRGTPADQSPAATVMGAWIAALTGQQAELARRLSALESITERTPMADGINSPQAALVLIRGLFGYEGPDQMLADIHLALDLVGADDTPWRAVAWAALGHAGYLTGDAALARTYLRAAASTPAAPAMVRLLSLSVQAFCEAEQGNTARCARLADESMRLATERGLDGSPQATWAFTATGVALAADGRLAESMSVLRQGLAVRRETPGLSPWPTIHHLLAMAGVAARTGDREFAERLLAEIDELTPWPDESMAATRSRIAATRRLLKTPDPTRPVAGDPLTPREREILDRLHGSQSLREIANDLYVSHNTVKTITLSVYRKLGVHSRAEALAVSGRD